MQLSETVGVGAIATALRRRDTYLGHAREAANLAKCLASYPKGLFEAAITVGRPAGDGHDTPVVLVHGFGHNRSAWFVLDRQLRAAGFTSVHTFNYNAFVHDVPEIAARLKDRIDLIRAVTGSAKVHLVGHSLGGVVIRWYAQELGGAEGIDTAVTVASPHAGTRAALLAVAGRRTARELMPQSDVMRTLASQPLPPSVRWVAYYSNLDLLIQPCASAKLPGAANLLVKDHGHVSILLSPRVARSIVDQLEASEGVAGMGGLRAIGSRSALSVPDGISVDAAAGR
jgi:pimeloyl-ACP methyl ester carboxylesterase